jgi:pimeloyl-ACP methyl ester carboxylesterase
MAQMSTRAITATRNIARLFVGTMMAASLAFGASAQTPGRAPPGPSTSRLFLDCRGVATASPLVILEAGAFGTSADWDRVLSDLAPGGLACAYDRAGLGRSPPTPGDDVSVLGRARELKTLLDQLGVPGPIILVGHSNGALYAEAFARLYPARVAGLVYVNGVGTDDLGHPRLMASLADERRLSDLAVTMAQLGLGSLVADELGEGGLSPEAARRKHAALTCLACLKVARNEDRALIAGLTATNALPPLPAAIPVVAITGDESPDTTLPRDWRVAEIAPAARADHSWILEAPGASHVSPLTRDRAYVAAAVGWLRAPFLGPPAGP